VARCPDGHESSAADYCDMCGIRIDAAPAAPSGSACPHCGAPGLERFCEACGYATGSVAGKRNTTWTAIVRPSRRHYEFVMSRGVAMPTDIEFPADWPERRFELAGSQLRVGRRSVSREVAPEVDLTGPPTDPGVSRLHTILIAQPDGSWAVEDPGSENGTIVNGSEIPVGELVPLTDGDTICIGAWTAITIVASTERQPTTADADRR
jgi:FHA domain